MPARWVSPRGKTPGRQTESGSPIPIGLSKSPQPVTRFLIWRTRFLSVFEEGDIAFGASFGPFPSGGEGLFLRRKDGTVVRILAVEDPTPAGGTFNVRYFEITFFGGLGNFVYALRGDSGGTDAMKGTSVLRLHIDAGGASTFV